MTFLTRFERWDPFDELTTLRNRMDNLMTRFGTEPETALGNWAPVSDVMELKDEVLIKTELPGIEPKDVDIQIENGMLTIKGERKAEKESEEKGYRRIERSYGSFYRAFTLPQDVEAEKISANFANGMLEVHMPKSETAKPRAIKVNVNKQLSTAA